MLGRNRNIPRSTRIQQKRKKRRIKRAFFVLMVVFTVFMIPFSLSRLDYLQIKDIYISGNSTVQTASIESAINENLSSKIWNLFPKKNIALFSVREIESKLKNNFPKIKDINISRKNTQKLAVSITEREPFAVWCLEEELDKCIFIDSFGFGYERSPVFNTDIFLRFFSENNKPEIKKTILDRNSLEEVRGVLSYLEKESIDVLFVKITEEKDLYFGLEGGSEIIFKIGEIKSGLINLDSVLDDASLGLRKDSGLDVDYIDLRFGNKVFYK